jgi:hypothetical protein
MKSLHTIAVPVLFTAAVSAVATVANAAWNERSTNDRLTGVKTVRMESPALAPIGQDGRAIVSRLVLQCIRPDDGATSYVGAFIVFSEPVAVVPDARMRLRVDDGEVENRIVGLSSRGDYIQIVAPETFVADHFLNSSRLRIDFPLLAGNALMEFNTKGAEAAIKKAQCR